MVILTNRPFGCAHPVTQGLSLPPELFSKDQKRTRNLPVNRITFLKACNPLVKTRNPLDALKPEPQ